VSIDPILAVKGIRSALVAKTVVAVSPIIGGQTIKGPAAKMYNEMGIQPSPLAVVNHYAGLLSGLVFDNIDADLERKIPIPVSVTQTIMKDQDDRYSLAQDVLNLIQKLRSADL
jgi:LPPG:FO 2-phospho-L-lactate transferase